TDVRDLLAQIVRKARAIEGADVTAGPAVSAVVPLDAARVTQAVLQLAQNGVTHGGGRLVIGSRLSGDALEIWVRDYGPGVPDDAKERVFERFQRGSESSRGSGLGLNIVQVIARAHGGSARVVDAYDGPGAVFVLSLPLRGSAAVGASGDAAFTPEAAVAAGQLLTPPTPPDPDQTQEEHPWPRS